MGKFKDVVNKMTKEYKDCLKAIQDSSNNTENDFLKKCKIELNGAIALKEKETIYYPKMLNIFYTLCSKLTDEEFDKFEAEIARTKGAEFLPNMKKKMVSLTPEFRGTKVEDLTLKKMYPFFSSAFFRDEVDQYNDFLIGLLGEDKCNPLTEEIEKFDPESIRYTHDFETDINKAKTALLNNNQISEEEKKQINEALDTINELEIVSASQIETFASSCDSISNKISRYHANQFIEENKLSDVYRVKDIGVEYKPEVLGNQELENKVLKSEYTITKEYKDTLISVYNKMDELGLLDENFVGEQDVKIYGFSHFRKAQIKMHNAIRNNDFKNIVKYKEEYVKEYNNLSEIYAFIKETIKPDFLHFPGNMTNYRQSFIPKEFANDLPVNASLNGFYYLFSSLKASNVTIDKFLLNPVIGCANIVDDLYKKDEVANTLNNVSYEEKIARMFNIRNYSVGRTTLRFLENVNCHEPNVNLRNEFENCLYVRTLDPATLTSPTYGDKFFSNHAEKTLLNILVTHNDNIPIEDLYGADYKSRDGLHVIKAFDIKTYIENHDVNVDDLISYAKTLIKEVSKVYETGVLKLDGSKLDREISEEKLAGMVGDFFRTISTSFVLLSETKDLSISEYDKIHDFILNPRESLKDLNLNEIVFKKCLANEIMSHEINRFVASNKFYSKLKDFNAKYGLNVTIKDFDEANNIDFSQNTFFEKKFVELFNQVWKKSGAEQKEFYNGVSITDKNALFEFATEINDIANIAIGEKLGIEGASPLETMTNKEKIQMFERAYGINRIVDVKLRQISFRSFNNSGYSNYNHVAKCEHFDSAYSAINDALAKYDAYSTYNVDQKKAFLQSYREVYQAMNQVHNTNWFFRMIMHYKDYKVEKRLLNETIDKISSTLKLDKNLVKGYLTKKDDILCSGTQEEFKTNPQNIKSYTYNEALDVSDAITSVNNKINEKFEIKTPEFDPLLRTFVNAEEFDLDNTVRVNIENIDLEDDKIDVKNNDVVFEKNKEKGLDK